MREIPEGYLDTLASGRNVIRDVRIGMLYAKIRIVTRDPVWSVQRWRTILSLLAGRAAQ